MRNTCCLIPNRSWSDQPLEFPSVPADLEDRPCPRRGQHGGGQAQRDDLRHGLDDVQVLATGWYDLQGMNMTPCLYCNIISIRFDFELIKD